MIVRPDWYDYATFDDEGFVNGIRDDAPEEIKRSYMEYVEKEPSLR